MKLLKILFASIALLLLGGLMGTTAAKLPASAATQLDPKDELAKEVHLLRLFLEKTHADDALRQSSAVRYQAQHETVASLRDRLEYLRSELGNLDAESTKVSARVKELESSLQNSAEQ